MREKPSQDMKRPEKSWSPSQGGFSHWMLEFVMTTSNHMVGRTI